MTSALVHKKCTGTILIMQEAGGKIIFVCNKCFAGWDSPVGLEIPNEWRKLNRKDKDCVTAHPPKKSDA